MTNKIYAIYRSAKVSWKTTAIGILVFLGVLIPNLINVLDGKPETIADWNAVVYAATAMLGLLFAKDGDKSSEDHMPAVKLKSNLP